MRTQALAPRTKRRIAGGRAHERQADHVAARFLRGEKGLARYVTPAPAAGFALPQSPGLPLIAGLRSEFETAFGADLGAVRVHTDAPAAAAAMSMNAFAFASGSDVYFAQGQFRPSSAHGRALLAHEITHVLQQTGRIARNGRMRATPMRSCGLVQRAAMPDFPTLKNLHAPQQRKAADPIVAKYQAIAAFIEQRLALADPGAGLDALVAEKIAEIGTWPAEAESLLYDSLKLKGRYGSACALIERDDFFGGIRIRTAVWSEDLMAALKKRNNGEAVLVKAAETHPVLQKYVDGYVRAVETALFQRPDAAIPRLERRMGKAAPMSIREEAIQLDKDLEDPTVVSSNEWFYSALLVVLALDGVRERKLAEIRNKAVEEANQRGEGALLAERRVAEGVKAWGDAFLQSTKGANGVSNDLQRELDPAWERFVRALGGRIRKAGADALAVWDRKDALEEARNAFFKAGSEKDPTVAAGMRAEAQATLARVKAASDEVAMPALVVQTLEELNRNSRTNAGVEVRPDPAEFRERASRLAERWSAFIRTKLEPAEIARFHERKTEDVAAYLWISLWADIRRSNLAWMAASDAGGANVPTTAHMHLQRLRFAGSMRSYGQLLGWADVVKAAEKILTAELEPEDVLAIVPDENGRYWNPKPAPTEEVAEVGPIEGWEPITGQVLALLYQQDYYRALAEAVGELLPMSTAEERRIVQAKAAVPFIITQAEKKLATLPRPEKWVVAANRWEYARKRGARIMTDAQLIQAHPSWKSELEPKLPAGYSAIFPIDLLNQPLRVWFVPRPWHILPTLKTIDVLNARVAAGVPGKGSAAEKLAAARALDDWAWWTALRKALQPDPKKAIDKEELKQLEAAVAATMKRERLAEQEGARDEMIRAMRVDRQLMANIIRGDLGIFAADHYRFDASEGVVTNIGQYAIAASRLWQYGLEGELVSDADANAALTALMLDIAPDLLKAFGSEERFDVVHGVLGYLDEASEFLASFETFTPKRRRRFLLPEEDTPAWLGPRKTALADITAHMREVRAAVQQKRGFKAFAKDSTVQVFMAYSKPLEPDMLIVPRPQGLLGDPSNERYRIVKVLQDFIFHPRYGYGAAQADVGGKRKPKTVRTGYTKARFLQHDDKTPVPAGKLLEIAVLKWDPKRKIHVPKGARQLGPEDEGWDELYDGLTWAAFGSAMETAQQIIEWQINLYLDVLEMIPGWGKIITAGRVAYAVVDFFASGTYEELMTILSGGLKETATALYDRLKEAVDPTVLIELLLFGDPRLDRLLAHTRLGAEAAPAAPQNPSKSRVRKIIAALKRLGRALFRVLRKLNDLVQTPMRDLRIFIATRPALAFAFGFAARHIYELERVGRAFASLVEGRGDAKAMTAELERQAHQEQTGFADSLGSILAQIESLRLPAQVIDVRPAYQAIIDALLLYAAKAIGTEARFVAMVLQRTGVLDLVTEQIAAAMVERGLDPNVFWREDIVPAISDQFNNARDALVGEVNRVLQSPALSGIFGKVSTPPPATISTDGPEFEETKENYVDPEPEAEATPLRSPDRPLRLRPPALPSTGPGTALAASFRVPMERAFGQDLGHVRLHTGSDADAMTEAFGVDGLTTGSHVFIRPGLTPETGRGAEVMRHELGHVVQQTGPRPLGGASSPVAVAGNASAGLAYDPARERRADALARQAETRLKSAGVPPAAFGAALSVASGLEPFDLDPYTVAKLLKDMSSLSEALKIGQAMERVRKPQPLPDEAARTAAAALKALKSLTSHPGLKKANVFIDALAFIEKRFNGKRQQDEVEEANLTDVSVQEVARDSLSPPASGKDASAKRQVIKPGEFCRDLESYVAARTGVVLGLKPREVAAPADATAKKTISDTDPFEEIRVLFIYLPGIDGRSPLWREAMDKTWPNQTPEFKQKARAVVRDVLTMKKVSIAVFAAFGKEYKFSILLRREVEELMNKPKAGALEAKDLPDWNTYVKTGEAEPNRIGVRLSTYGHASQKASGRESHHLTQFLVADYFVNANDTAKPFRANRNYPGVKWKGDRVTSVAPDEGATGIDVLKTYGAASNRGRDMPTISLAAATHRGGDLHITPEADDLNDEDPKKSQAYTVHNRYRAHLPAALREDASAATYNAYLKVHNESEVAAKIYSAAQTTYRWVESEMSKKLTASMPELEFQYFLGLAQFNTAVDINHNDSEKKKFLAALQKVEKDAKDHNNTVMSKLGWKLS
jgi:hypothetical protein